MVEIHKVELESRGLEGEACALVEPEHEVHVLHSLTRSSLEQIVDDTYYE